SGRSRLFGAECAETVERAQHGSNSRLADFVAREMSRQCVHEFAAVEGIVYLLADIVTEQSRRVADFLHQRWTAVDDGDDVFQIAARVDIAPATAAKGFQFGCDEVRCRDDAQLEIVDG